MSGLLTIAVGLITDPHQAEAILQNGEADLVGLARAFCTSRAGAGRLLRR